MKEKRKSNLIYKLNHIINKKKKIKDRKKEK